MALNALSAVSIPILAASSRRPAATKGGNNFKMSDPKSGTIGSLRHVATALPDKYNKGYSYHSHGLTKSAAREYIETGKTDGIVINCYYLTSSYYTKYFPGEGRWSLRFPHDLIIEAAKLRGIEKHICENVVTREEVITKEVVIERTAREALELSFGEDASLTASLQHGQHILNDDLRRAMAADDRDEIARCQNRLADHVTLMEKLGVPRANWDDNYQAMLRAGRVEIDLPVIELSIWS